MPTISQEALDKSLILACAYRSQSLVGPLLDSGANPNYIDRAATQTSLKNAIFAATTHFNASILKLLTTRGANVNISIDNTTLLHVTLKYHNMSALHVLINNGNFNLDVQNKVGVPIWLSKISSYIWDSSMVNEILQHADLFQTDRSGNNVLMMAIAKLGKPIRPAGIKTLLECEHISRVNILKVNKRRKTALDLITDKLKTLEDRPIKSTFYIDEVRKLQLDIKKRTELQLAKNKILEAKTIETNSSIDTEVKFR